MKKLLLSVTFSLMAFPTYSAVGWFFKDEINAINSAMGQSMMDNKFRGSSLKSIDQLRDGVKINLTNNCTIYLDKMPMRESRGGMTGPNPKIAFKINQRMSNCGR